MNACQMSSRKYVYIMMMVSGVFADTFVLIGSFIESIYVYPLSSLSILSIYPTVLFSSSRFVFAFCY